MRIIPWHFDLILFSDSMHKLFTDVIEIQFTQVQLVNNLVAFCTYRIHTLVVSFLLYIVSNSVESRTFFLHHCSYNMLVRHWLGIPLVVFTMYNVCSHILTQRDKLVSMFTSYFST